MSALYFFDAATGRGVWGPHVTDAPWQPENLALAKANAEARLGLTLAEHLADADLGPAASLLAVIEAGQVVSAGVDPAWVAPPPPPSPTEELYAALSRNNLTSVHDKKWADAKERIKEFGIPWVQANPDSTEADAFAAINADLAGEFPEIPPDRLAGLTTFIMWSYAAEALIRGYIAAADYEHLRDLIVGSTPQQLRQMLRTM